MLIVLMKFVTNLTERYNFSIKLHKLRNWRIKILSTGPSYHIWYSVVYLPVGLLSMWWMPLQICHNWTESIIFFTDHAYGCIGHTMKWYWWLSTFRRNVSRPSSGSHCCTAQKNTTDIFTAVRTLNLSHTHTPPDSLRTCECILWISWRCKS
jgi:hypothetical protein